MRFHLNLWADADNPSLIQNCINITFQRGKSNMFISSDICLLYIEVWCHKYYRMFFSSTGYGYKSGTFYILWCKSIFDSVFPTLQHNANKRFCARSPSWLRLPLTPAQRCSQHRFSGSGQFSFFLFGDGWCAEKAVALVPFSRSCLPSLLMKYNLGNETRV